MDVLWIGAGVAVLFFVLLIVWWRRSRRDASASQRAHEAAKGREPPVDIGETYEFGIVEFTDHHSGDRVAVGKVEGFVLFGTDAPEDAEVGDVVRAKVLSFNRDETSADAQVIEVV